LWRGLQHEFLRFSIPAANQSRAKEDPFMQRQTTDSERVLQVLARRRSRRRRLQNCGGEACSS
jgi:hypothetical protein